MKGGKERDGQRETEVGEGVRRWRRSPVSALAGSCELCLLTNGYKPVCHKQHSKQRDWNGKTTMSRRKLRFWMIAVSRTQWKKGNPYGNTIKTQRLEDTNCTNVEMHGLNHEADRH